MPEQLQKQRYGQSAAFNHAVHLLADAFGVSLDEGLFMKEADRQPRYIWAGYCDRCKFVPSIREALAGRGISVLSLCKDCEEKGG